VNFGGAYFPPPPKCRVKVCKGGGGGGFFFLIILKLEGQFNLIGPISMALGVNQT
jgi:hypothetical protein